MTFGIWSRMQPVSTMSVLAFFIALELVKNVKAELTYSSSICYYGHRVDIEWHVHEQDRTMIHAILPRKQIS
ncbi:hypothetical protein O6H91_08G118200 [Diphasiastrum complanatum]|uniref:Uncharacterized protein n=1 Tax=Diphasiastrum complanatum TaxID=34168 RepID=A0ACC2D1D9_DIPCM|nr:hypothetical protein O6H91_08G118200 [Diphasiastrum complanatum]